MNKTHSFMTGFKITAYHYELTRSFVCNLQDFLTIFHVRFNVRLFVRFLPDFIAQSFGVGIDAIAIVAYLTLAEQFYVLFGYLVNASLEVLGVSP